MKIQHLTSAVVMVLASVLLAGAGVAQSAADANLQPASREILERLSGLRQVADGRWKIHSGDLAHGEAVDLDDRSWQPVEVGYRASDEAIWLRQTYEVPPSLRGYDLTGCRIWFDFHSQTNGPVPQIIYFNGRRVAMGEELEPIVLLDDVKPGDRMSVAIKLLHTADAKRIEGAHLRIEFADGRPSPEDLRQEFLVATRLVPSLSANPGPQLEILNDAIRTVSFEALDRHDQAGFDASLREAHHKLEPLRPLLRRATFHVTGNAHIDAAWLWPWTETVDVVKRTFGTALQLMYEYPDYTFTQSAAAYNAWIAEKYPDLNRDIAKRVKEGRWEVVGGMWVEPDLNMPDGESLVRQLLVGKRWFKNEYGVDIRVGWNPDSFGYTWQLPQIYKKSGVDYFVTQKMIVNDTNQLPFKLFWWESPDGSKVLAYFPHDYFNANLTPERLSADFATARMRSPGETEMMDLYGVSDHGGGPTRAMLDEGFHWTGPGHVMPNYQFGTAQSFFSSIEKQVAPESREWNYQSIAKGYTAPPAVPGKVSIPTWKSELYFEYHRGVMTTQANHKRNMRDAEVEVLDAEKWASLAWLFGGSYSGDELTEDWKKILFNQFHDLAAGSGVASIYKDAQRDYDVVRWSTNEISAKALDLLAEKINTDQHGQLSAKQSIVVFNPLGWARSGEVSVRLPGYPDGFSVRNPQTGAVYSSKFLKKSMKDGIEEFRIPVADVPPLGYLTLLVSPKDKEGSTAMNTTVRAENNTYILENRFLRVVIDIQSGCITSLYDKLSRFETLTAGGCGNELQAFRDTPREYDAWNIDPGTLDRAPTLLNHADKVELDGEDSVRVTRSWQSSKFVQTIRLSESATDVDIDNEIDWHETHVLLKAAFPLAASGPFATYEIPYGSIERSTTRNNSWEKAQFEVAALRWADLGDGEHGLSVLNNSKYGYDAVGNVLRISLLRSPTWPDPDADRGHHHFHYGLYPHAGTWKDALTVRHGYDFNYPLSATVTTLHAGSLPAEHSFASVKQDNVVLTAVKKAEDADGLMFRMYEFAGKEANVDVSVPPGAIGATVTNMMEMPEGSPIVPAGDIITVPIHPYEILTLRVSYRPLDAK
jgi:alpha-mannosidase